MNRVVVLGDEDVARRTCALLQSRGIDVTHLANPDDVQIQHAMQHDVLGVAVLLHDDIKALRYGLLIHHIRPSVPLIVTMFDTTARRQLESHVPHCSAISPASLAVPSMVAAALDLDALAVRRRNSSDDASWVQVSRDFPHRVSPFETPRNVRRQGIIGRLRGQFYPFDAGTKVLLTGAVGLILMILVDTVLGARHEQLTRALYDAVRTTATISAPELADSGPELVWASIAALLVLTFTALFAAGIVNYVLSGRHISLAGRRVLPRSGHVIVVGTGQVGLRFMAELRALGIATLGIEKFEDARTLPIAKNANLPVLIGDGSSRVVLEAAATRRSLSVVAAASEERDNIAVAVSALAQDPATRIVLRAGSDEAITESQSLFRIGPVVDVNGITAAFVTQTFVGEQPYLVTPLRSSFLAFDHTGQVLETYPAVTQRCQCD
mgnify:CR=1 FL=1